MSFLEFAASGPVSGAFIADRTFVSGIMGPVGSGKTRAALMKGLYIGLDQAPSPVDGVRYSRGVVIRDTYRNMGKNILPSWFKCVPREFGTFKDGGMNAPSVHHMRFKVPNLGVVDIEIIFAAVGEADVESFCKGFEVTWAYCNEVDLLSDELLQYLPDRTGRFPDNTHGGCTWRGVWCDFNAPDVDSWVYADFVEKAEETGYQLFVQPGGRDPNAENVENLPPGYYANAVRGKKAWYVRRMIDNKFGYSRAGKPVFEEEYNDHVHCAARPLDPVPGLKLEFGADAGLTPAIVIGQRMPNGQRRVLDELVETRAGAKRFGEALNRLLAERYPGYELGTVWCDPAALSASATDAEERSWAEIFAATTKLKVKAAPTNALLPRLEAVTAPLGRLIDGQPGLLISPRCKILRRGFLSGYQLRRIKVGNSERYDDVPLKNEFSHPMDSLQYWCSGSGEHAEVTGRAKRQEEARRWRPERADGDYDPFAA